MSAEQLIAKHLDIWTSAHKTRSSAGRGSSNKLDLYGIKKLRELILELAVRGKLVPQDPNDEPASELLKKIENEKKKLLTEGKIKKEKALPKISPEEILSELPFNWCWTQLGLITNYGTTTKVDSIESDCWVLDLEDIEKDTSKLIQKVRFSERASLSDKNSFSRGDVLYGKLRPYLNKVIVADEDGVCTTEILPIRPYIELNSEYLKIVLKSPSFLNYVNDRSYGMKMPRLGTDDGRKASVPLAPLAEQHRIVSKVNELMAFCDELEQVQTDNIAAHEQLVEALLTTLTNSKNHQELQANWQRIADHFDTLFTTEDSIDQLKQTILQLAVMGKLVPQDPNDEPASELLKKIAAEKAQLIKEGKIKKEKPLPEVTDEEKPFELPNCWEWTRLGDITDIKGGKRVSNGYKLLKTPTPFIYIRVSDFKDGTIDDTDLHYIDAKMREQISRYVISKDDLYMTIVGATIGKCGIVPPKFDNMNLTENAARLVLSRFTDKLFVLNCLTSSFCQSQFIDKTMQVGVQKMALNRLASSLIPLPPLNEQHRIVAKVSELMAICDLIKNSLQDAKNTQFQVVDALIEQVVC